MDMGCWQGIRFAMGKSSRRVRTERSVTAPAPSPAAPRATALALAVFVAATPLAFAPGLFLSHDVMPKVVFTLAGAALLLLLLQQWMPGAVRLARSGAGKTFLILLAAQAASLVISTVFSSAPGLSLGGTTWRRFGTVEQLATLVIALAAAAVTTLDRRWTVTLFRAVSLGGVTASFYGICQYFGADPFLETALYKVEYLGGIVRPPATMGHAIYFAGWLVPVALITAGCAATETERAWKWLHAATASLAVVAIFLSGTRGALIATLVAGVFLLIRAGGESAGAMRRHFGVAFAAVTVILIAVTLSPAGEGIRHRLLQWRQDLGGPRVSVWRESPAILIAHPIVGTGPETFGEEFRRIESEKLSHTYPDFFNETPHNVLIDAACAQGLPGLVILSAVFWLGIFGPRRDLTGTALEAAVLGIFAGSMFASFSIVEAMVLWVLVGVGAACADDSVVAASETTPAPALLIPATVLAGCFFFFAVILGVPDHRYAGVSDAVAAKDLDRAHEIYASANGWSAGLPLAGYALYSSQQYAVLARLLADTPQASDAWALSRTAAGEAERRGEQRYSAAFQSSVLSIAAGDLATAEAKARLSIALAPNWYRPRVFLAQILQATGRNQEAVMEQKRSVELGADRKY